MVQRWNSIAMMRLSTPIRLRLPNNRTFIAKYRRREKKYLPANVTIKRSYEKIARRGQGMQRVEEKSQKPLMQAYKWLSKTDPGKKLGGEALWYAPTLFEKGVSKIKNDKVRSFKFQRRKYNCQLWVKICIHKY